MTLGKLNEHLNLLQTIAKANDTLAALWDAASSTNSTLTGMPHGSGVSDSVGYYAAEIADLSGQINFLQQQLKTSEEDILQWISTVQDGTVRIALRLHYVRGLQWKEVAPAVGKYSTASSVKSMCYRYVEQHGDTA